MHVGVRDMILQHAGYSSIAEGLDALDLDTVELALTRGLTVALPDAPLSAPGPGMDSTEAMSEVKRQYAAAGIHISGLLLANNFNAEDVDAEIEWVAQAVRIAEGLGADAVRTDSAMTGQQEIDLRERIDIYARAIARVLAATPDSQVPLAIENHGIQGNDPEWMQGVLDAADSPRVGITLDTGNFYWAGHPLDRVHDLIAQFAPRASHVHCKNICFEPEQRSRRRQAGWGYGDHVCPIPDGDIDHARVVRVLADAGFRGALNIEDEALARFEGAERRRQLRRDADHLAEIAQAVGGARRRAAGPTDPRGSRD